MIGAVTNILALMQIGPFAVNQTNYPVPVLDKVRITLRGVIREPLRITHTVSAPYELSCFRQPGSLDYY